MSRRNRTLGDLRRASAMQAIDASRPLRGWMLQQHGAVVFEVPRQLHPWWILNLGRLQERPQQRGSREVCDGESLADEIRAALPLILDSIKCRCHDGPISRQIAFADAMAESVERWKNPEPRLQPAGGLVAHARRQHAQRNVWIVLEQLRNDSGADRRAKRVIEIVLECERAPPRGAVARIKWRLGVMLLERRDDARGIGDGPAVEPQNGQFTLARRAQDADQVVGAENAASVRDALVVKRPAHFFVVVRKRDVPEQRRVYGFLSGHQYLTAMGRAPLARFRAAAACPCCGAYSRGRTADRRSRPAPSAATIPPTRRCGSRRRDGWRTDCPCRARRAG